MTHHTTTLIWKPVDEPDPPDPRGPLGYSRNPLGARMELVAVQVLPDRTATGNPAFRFFWTWRSAE